MAHKALKDDFLDRAMGKRRVEKKLVDELKADDGTTKEPPATTVLDDDGAAPAVAPEAAPATPAPAAPAASPTPAPEIAPAATPAPVAGVPIHVYTDVKADLKAAREESARIRQELEEARKPKPAETAKPPEDVEPDPKTHPVEHDQWEIRDLRRQQAEDRKLLTEMRTGLQQRTEQENYQRDRQNFLGMTDQLVERHRTGAIVIDGAPLPAIPDIKERRDFMRQLLVDENIDSGYDEATSRQLAGDQELAFYMDCARRKIDPILALSKLATRRGYAAAAPAAAAPAAATPAARISREQKVQAAARSASSMPGAPPPKAEEGLSFDKWQDMSPAEKRAYRKQHPEIKGPMASLWLDDSRP